MARDANAAHVTAIPLGRRLPGASSNLPGRQIADTRSEFRRLRGEVSRRPYSVLLPVGFALPPSLPKPRCALTAPFHPCRPPTLIPPPQAGEGREGAGGLISVALSLRDAALARGISRRTLSGTACPWSPDFPPVPPFGDRTSGRPAD